MVFRQNLLSEPSHLEVVCAMIMLLH
jgi:hypothetical protein